MFPSAATKGRRTQEVCFGSGTPRAGTRPGAALLGRYHDYRLASLGSPHEDLGIVGVGFH